VFDTAGQLDTPWQTLVSCVARVWRLTYIKMALGRPEVLTVCFRSGPQCWTDASATKQSSSRRNAPGF